MENYIAVVFDSDRKACDALHALWNLDNTGDITVQGASVIRRDSFGHVDVATRDNDPAVRAIVGTGIGALLGALAASGFAMNAGQSAVINAVHRRSKGDVRAASFFGDRYEDYLYPYDYEPIFVT